MSTYAILGATGQVGSSILQVLLQQPDRKIRCFVRSASKLESQNPDIHSRSNVKIFESDVTAIPVLTDCLRGTSAAFLCVANSVSRPGERIAQIQVKAVVTALEELRRQNAQLPSLILLSSASIENEPRLCREIPKLAHKLLFACNYYVYMDLIEAEKYLQAREDWINVVYFKPGGFCHDIQRGHVLSEDNQQTYISLLDVGAGMIECADEGERWRGKHVSVLSKSPAKIEWSSIPVLGRGLLLYLVPSLQKWL